MSRLGKLLKEQGVIKTTKKTSTIMSVKVDIEVAKKFKYFAKKYKVNQSEIMRSAMLDAIEHFEGLEAVLSKSIRKNDDKK
jgi:predicted transcriptional regulator